MLVEAARDRQGWLESYADMGDRALGPNPPWGRDAWPSAFVIPPSPLGITWSGSQLQISWTHGTLQSSATVNGTYVDVPGNPTSPYLVTPTGESTFYRARN